MSGTEAAQWLKEFAVEIGARGFFETAIWLVLIYVVAYVCVFGIAGFIMWRIMRRMR